MLGHDAREGEEKYFNWALKASGAKKFWIAYLNTDCALGHA